jgi:hypothetical protein
MDNGGLIGDLKYSGILVPDLNTSITIGNIDQSGILIYDRPAFNGYTIPGITVANPQMNPQPNTQIYCSRCENLDSALDNNHIDCAKYFNLLSKSKSKVKSVFSCKNYHSCDLHWRQSLTHGHLSCLIWLTRNYDSNISTSPYGNSPSVVQIIEIVEYAIESNWIECLTYFIEKFKNIDWVKRLTLRQTRFPKVGIHVFKYLLDRFGPGCVSVESLIVSEQINHIKCYWDISTQKNKEQKQIKIFNWTNVRTALWQRNTEIIKYFYQLGVEADWDTINRASNSSHLRTLVDRCVSNNYGAGQVKVVYIDILESEMGTRDRTNRNFLSSINPEKPDPALVEAISRKFDVYKGAIMDIINKIPIRCWERL